MAKLICIEGPDQVGKATQSNMLLQFLQHQGKKATLVEVPVIDRFTHKAIYWALRSGTAKAFPRQFQWLQYANKRIFQEIELPKLEKQYDFIIFDRWSLSSIVYGSASGVDAEYTMSLFSKLRVPDATVILIGPSKSDRKDDVYEKDVKMQQTVRILYKEWARNNALNGCKMVSNEGSRDQVHENIVGMLYVMDVL